MQEEECPVCLLTVVPGLSIKHECGHRTHGECMDQDNPNFEKCARCLNIAPKLAISQPTSFEGNDYVMNPIGKSILGSIKKIWSKEVPIQTRLQEGKPLEHLMAKYDCHLQRMLANGITLDDFLMNGYTFDDLQVYDDIKNGGDRAKKALIALQCNAEHLRSMPTLPYISAKSVVEDFGLYFPENDALSVVGGKNQEAWTLADLDRLGFTVKDLFGAGLTLYEQYEDLEPTPQLERKMGITKRDLDELMVQTRVVERPMREVYHSPEPVRRESLLAPIPVAKPKRKLHGLKKK